MDKEYLTMHPNAMPAQEAAMTYLFTYAPPIQRVCPPAAEELPARAQDVCVSEAA